MCMKKPALLRTAIGFGAGAIRPMEKALARGELERAAEIFIRRVLGDAIFEGLSDARKQQCFDNSSTILAFIRNPDVPDFSPQDAKNLHCPVLFMQGALTPGWTSPFMDYVAGLLPDVKRVTIPGASHFMHEASPTATNSALLAFFEECGSEGA